jgi:cellulose biosynthesis protein BcsQ
MLVKWVRFVETVLIVVLTIVHKITYFCPQKTRYKILMATVIAVHTSKGGMGKSTISAVLASFLAYQHRQSVVVLDADSPQFSISNLRQREKAVWQRFEQEFPTTDSLQGVKASDLSAIDQAMFERYRHNLNNGLTDLYPVYALDGHALANADMDAIRDAYDYVLIDLGGKFDEGIIRALSVSDLILVPFTTQQVDVVASLQYCSAINQFAQKGILMPHLQVRCFWNKFKFTFEKKASMLELAARSNFSQYDLNIDFLKTRLNAADTGFDRTKLLTTLSTPVLFEEGQQYIEGVRSLVAEVEKLAFVAQP